MPANPRTAQLNTTRILREIWVDSGISRVELSRRLDVDKSTVTLAVTRMLDEGIIQETRGERANSGSGRTPLGLKARADYAAVLGLEILPRTLRYCLVRMNGEVAEEGDLELENNRGEISRRSIEAVVELYRRFSVSDTILGVGAAVSGIVDSGELRQSGLFRLDSPIQVASLLQERLDTPVLVENDANACAWGELVSRRDRHNDDFLFVLLESEGAYPRLSMGLGFCIDGRVHRGPSHTSGEFRSVLWNGDSDTQFSVGSAELARLDDDGELRHRLYAEIGSNVALLVNSLNLSSVCVGGDATRHWEELERALREAIDANWAYPGPADCQMSRSGYGAYAAAYGAAGMHLERIFASKHVDDFETLDLRTGLEALVRP